jgi:hypothetical protein
MGGPLHLLLTLSENSGNEACAALMPSLSVADMERISFGFNRCSELKSASAFKIIYDLIIDRGIELREIKKHKHWLKQFSYIVNS